MNLAFLFALGVVLVYSFTEDGTIEGPYSMHTKPWDAFAANINVVAIFPLDMLGETRLNEDETKLTLHLALKRIHDEDLIDPKYLRLDETTIRLIPNYCDSEKILKKVLQIYNQPSASKTSMVKQPPFIIGFVCDVVCWALSSLYRESRNATIFALNCLFSNTNVPFGDSGNMIKMSGNGLRLIDTLMAFIETMEFSKRLVILTTPDRENTFLTSVLRRKFDEFGLKLVGSEIVQGCSYRTKSIDIHYKGYRKLLKQYKDKANVFILFMADCSTVQIMKAAFDEGMNKYNYNKHVFIAHHFTNVNPEKFLTLERNKVYQCLEGMISINIKKPSLLTYHEFVLSIYEYTKYYNSMQPKHLHKHLKGEVSVYSALLYDSLYLLAEAVNSTFKNNSFNFADVHGFFEKMDRVDALPFGRKEGDAYINLATGRMAFLKDKEKRSIVRDMDYDITYMLKGVMEPMYTSITYEEEKFFNYYMPYLVYLLKPTNDSLQSKRPIKLLREDGIFRWVGNFKDDFFDVFEATSAKKSNTFSKAEDHRSIVLEKVVKEEKRSFGKVYTFIATIVWIIFWASRILNLDNMSETSTEVEVFKIKWHEISTPDKIDFDEHNVLAQEAKQPINMAAGKEGKGQQQFFKASLDGKNELKYKKKTHSKKKTQTSNYSNNLQNRAFSNNLKKEGEYEAYEEYYYDEEGEKEKEEEEEEEEDGDDDDLEDFVNSLVSNENDDEKTVESLFIGNLLKKPKIIDHKALKDHLQNNITFNNINKCLEKVNKNENNYLTNLRSNLSRPDTRGSINTNLNRKSPSLVKRAPKLSNILTKNSKNQTENKKPAGVKNVSSLKFYTEVGTYKTQVCSILRINSNINRVNFRNKQFLSELKDLTNIRHQNLNLFLGVCLEMPNCCLVYLYNKFGSIRDLITDSAKHMHSGDNKLSFLLDITIGMEYLHRTVIKYHGHLSSKNCVVDNRWTCKITDYGVPSLQAEKVSNVHKSSDDLLYTAPEILRSMSSDKGTVEADVYAFAIITHEIITWDLPYAYERKKKPVSQILKKIEEGDMMSPVRPKLRDIAEGWVNILNSCWHEIPSYRPTFKTLCLEIKRMAKGRTIHRMDVTLEKLRELNNRLQSMVAKRTKDLQAKKEEVEALVFNILPKQVAKSLLANQTVDPEEFESSTVYFSDIVGFNKLCKNRDPTEVITFLNDVFKNFDLITNKYEVFKFGTTRDIYMAVSGAPKVIQHHASEMATMALDMFSLIDQLIVPGTEDNILQIRIGLHTGPVVAGVLGTSLPQYCVYGDSVNTASRMQTSGYALKVHLSASTALRLDKLFELKYRGVLNIKGKGEMETYWLKGKNSIPKMRVPDERLAARASLHYFK